ncbi:MAG: YIP1 family protein [Bacteroidota bacterium]|nr:YIP1 family protein [Bacteroidota bacterium]
MNFSFVFNRAKNLIINARAEWIAIQSEARSKQFVVKKFVIPFMIIIAGCSIAGDFIFASRLGSFSLIYVLCKAIGVVAAVYGGTIISALIINEITASFNSKKDTPTTFNVVIYSLSAFYLTTAFVMFLPALGVLAAFGFYSIYLFWQGAAMILETPEDNRAGFVVVSSLVVLGIYAILNLILRAILTGIFGVSLTI